MRLESYNSFSIKPDIDVFNNIANNLGDEGLYTNLGNGRTSFGINGKGGRLFRYIHAVDINGHDNFKRLIKDAAARFIDLGFLELRIGPSRFEGDSSSFYSYGEPVISSSAKKLNTLEEFYNVIDDADFSKDARNFENGSSYFNKGVILFVLD